MAKVKVKLSEAKKKIGRTHWAFLKNASTMLANKTIQLGRRKK